MTPIIEHRILPMRTARLQFELAGVETVLTTINPQSNLAYVGGKGGPACMELQEWEKYKILCATWSAAPLDLEGAPTVSMMLVDSEEAMRQVSQQRIEPDDLGRICRSLRISLKEARECVVSAQRTLSVEDYGEALEAAEKKLAQALDQIAGLMASPQEEEAS
jgi:hypothetical protein